MKKLFTLGGALLFAFTAWADSYPYLVFQTSDNGLLSCDAETVHITFAGEEAVVRDANGEHRLPLVSLSKMYFSSAPTAIVFPKSAALSNAVSVYTLSGVYVGTFDSQRAAASSLGSGMYLLKDQNGVKVVTGNSLR
ncbi:MAG: hypothetical protein ACI4BA_04915 [Prevotella sp.]